MSRRNTKVDAALKGPNPSHPSELNHAHRQFLIRSIDRNDVDLAALMELNVTLRKVKQAILETCGEMTLLDLGEGKIHLSPEEAGGSDSSGDVLRSKSMLQTTGSDKLSLLDKAGQELCVDFLLRMKLRRKLLNRLVRRLARVAHAMDGNEVGPPVPPKYGDLRLDVKPESVDAYSNHWDQQVAALQKIQAEREIRGKDRLVATEVEKEKTKEVEKESEDREEQDVKMREDTANVTCVATTDKSTPENVKTVPETESAKADAKEADVSALQPKEGDAPVSADPIPSTPVKATSVPPTDASVSAETKGNTDDPNPAPPANSLAAAYSVLRDYDDAYEKLVNPKTGAVTYTILNQDHQDDYLAIKSGAGIGAAHMSMSAKEKEAEFKRWEASILAKIPQQPTFEDLGMKNRVFFIKERRKRAMKQLLPVSPLKKAKEVLQEKKKLRNESDMDVDPQENNEGKPKTEENETIDQEESKVGDDGNDSDDDNAMDTDKGKKKDVEDEKIDADEDATVSDDKKAEGTKEDGEDEKEEDSPENQTDEAEGTNDAIKIMRPISLLPVPSFYEQDLRRTRLVHQELMMSSIQSHAQRRLEDVTRDYNKALRTSNELYDRRQAAQAKLNAFVYDNRNRLNMLKNEYSVNHAVSLSRWNKKREAFEHEKLNKALPSRWGHPNFGTPSTQRYTSHPNPVAQQIGLVVADLVDAVDQIGQGQIHITPFREPFYPPKAPDLANTVVDPKTGETYLQRSQRMETAYRNEASKASTSLRASEDDRAKSWKKMMKTKAELEMPYRIAGGTIKPGQLHQVPCPALRQGSTQSIRQTASVDKPMPSYTPNTTYLPQEGSSQSKYSAARIRERVSVDGSVAPASQPKKGKDGLFQRPAGRTRKGMDWDAVRGVWVPKRE